MFKTGTLLLLVCALALSMPAACGKSTHPVSSDTRQEDNGGNTDNPDVDTSQETDDSEDTGEQVEENLAGNVKDHEDTGDYVWTDSEVIPIVLNGTSITADSTRSTVAGSKVTITSAGTYSIRGNLSNGRIIVNTQDKEIVRLILNGVDISSSTSAPIYIASAKKVVIVLADNTENRIKDATSYVYDNAAEKEPNAAIFSTADLTLCGNGSLTVEGRFNDGISSKDGLIIKNTAITVNSADDGIVGKDYLVVKNGVITVNAKANGLKSDNADDARKGYVSVETGVLNITAAGDAISAQTDVLISDGKLNLSSGGGSKTSVTGTISAKGIKGVVNTTIDGGTFTINSADDAIHSNGRVAINGGTFAISSGDDGVHADSTLWINGGDIDISKSYEGIESANIVINHGTIHITASDDGLNVAGGNDGSGMHGWPGGMISSGNYYLNINGGKIAITANGDGVDVNGSIVMTDGEMIVNGPISNGNGALDYDGTFKISGGFVVAAGSSGMAQAPGSTSTQCSVLMNFRSAFAAGTLFNIQTSDGNQILSFTPTKKYQSIAFSSSELKDGATYNVYYGGSSTGSVNDGLYQGGVYTPGTLYTSFTVSGNVTKVTK